MHSKNKKRGPLKARKQFYKNHRKGRGRNLFSAKSRYIQQESSSKSSDKIPALNSRHIKFESSSDEDVKSSAKYGSAPGSALTIHNLPSHKERKRIPTISAMEHDSDNDGDVTMQSITSFESETTPIAKPKDSSGGFDYTSDYDHDALVESGNTNTDDDIAIPKISSDKSNKAYLSSEEALVKPNALSRESTDTSVPAGPTHIVPVPTPSPDPDAGLDPDADPDLMEIGTADIEGISTSYRRSLTPPTLRPPRCPISMATRSRPRIRCFSCGTYDINFKRHWTTKCGRDTVKFLEPYKYYLNLSKGDRSAEIQENLKKNLKMSYTLVNDTEMSTKPKIHACKVHGPWTNPLFSEYIEDRRNTHKHSSRLFAGDIRVVQPFNAQNSLLSNMLLNLCGNVLRPNDIRSIVISIDSHFPDFIAIISNVSTGSTTSNYFKAIYHFLNFLSSRKTTLDEQGIVVSNMIDKAIQRIKRLEPKYSGKKITEALMISPKINKLKHYSYYMKMVRRIDLEIPKNPDLTYNEFKRFQYIYVLLVVASNGGRPEFAYKQTVGDIDIVFEDARENIIRKLFSDRSILQDPVNKDERLFFQENGGPLPSNVNYYLVELLKEVGWEKDDGSVYTFRQAAVTSAKYTENETDITAFLRAYSTKTSAAIYDKKIAKKVAIKACKLLRALENEDENLCEEQKSKYYIDGKFNVDSIPPELREILVDNDNVIGNNPEPNINSNTTPRCVSKSPTTTISDSETDVPTTTSHGKFIGLSFGKRDETFSKIQLPIFINCLFDISSHTIDSLKVGNKWLPDFKHYVFNSIALLNFFDSSITNHAMRELAKVLEVEDHNINSTIKLLNSLFTEQKRIMIICALIKYSDVALTEVASLPKAKFDEFVDTKINRLAKKLQITFFWRTDLRVQAINVLNNCVFVDYSELTKIINKYGGKKKYQEISSKFKINYIKKVIETLKTSLPTNIDEVRQIQLFDKDAYLRQQLEEKLKYQKELEAELERLRELKIESVGDARKKLKCRVSELSATYMEVNASINEINESLNKSNE
uniref:DUF659 domain-containing protein n=1 Tax=Strongyloides stercoralis TaxID=6248 RepID=A0A0K0EG07_STRER